MGRGQTDGWIPEDIFEGRYPGTVRLDGSFAQIDLPFRFDGIGVTEHLNDRADRILRHVHAAEEVGAVEAVEGRRWDQMIAVIAEDDTCQTVGGDGVELNPVFSRRPAVDTHA